MQWVSHSIWPRPASTRYWNCGARDMGFVTQFLHCLPRKATLDVVAQPLFAAWRYQREARERAANCCRCLNLPERLWAVSPATFSGGEHQRVNLARGLIARPRCCCSTSPRPASTRSPPMRARPDRGAQPRARPCWPSSTTPNHPRASRPGRRTLTPPLPSRNSWNAPHEQALLTRARVVFPDTVLETPRC